jgi:hypothetical protein
MRDKSPPPPSGKRPAEGAQANPGANQGPNQSANPPATQPAGQAAQEKPALPADSEAPPPAAAQNEAPRPAPGGSYEFHTDPWAALYAKHVDEMIAALKSKGVPVIWVGTRRQVYKRPELSR